jgi:hypothetical protein
MTALRFFWFVTFFSLFFCLLSCTPGLINVMERGRNGPEITDPQVSCFQEPGVIIVSWEDDPLTDGYVLSRALDTDRVYKEIYRGSSPGFLDHDISREVRYLYCLSKVRGNHLFGPSKSVLGVGSFTRADPYESNNTVECAYLFMNNLEANTYGYKSIGHEYSLTDPDYYRVIVKPHMTAVYTVDVLDVSGFDTTGMECRIQYREPQDVVDLAGIAFENGSSSPVEFIFCLYPKESDISQNVTEGGGRFISYRLNYIGESPAP